MCRALLLVDAQNDFINGNLPVPGAEKAMDELADFISSNPDSYQFKILTLDWHPWNHSSFIENGGKWPRHCVEYSSGAAIWATLFPALYNDDKPVHFYPKGQRIDKDEYSIFQNEKIGAHIKKLLSYEKIGELDICGLAGDVCVLNTYKDALRLLPDIKINILKDFSPSLDGGIALEKILEAC